MGAMAAQSRVHLIVGEEAFLIERTRSQIVAEARAAAGSEDVPVAVLRAGDATANEMAEMLSPSLFAEDRIVVIEAADAAGKEPAQLVTDVAQDPPEGITLIVVHSGGGRTKAMVGAITKSGAQVHQCPAVKWPNERADFVKAEFARNKVKASADVIEQLMEAVGSDLRELASAVSQLCADTGGKVDLAAVTRYYSGRAEVKGFEIADKAVLGDRAGALEALRWAEHGGVPHVLIADALAEAVHRIARARGLGRMNQYDAASELGMPPRRAQEALRQARAWDSESVAKAMAVVATLNGDVKGQAADADYSLQHAVGMVADLRPSRSRR